MVACCQHHMDKALACCLTLLAVNVLSFLLVVLQYRRVHTLTEAARRMWQPPSFQQRYDGPPMSKRAPLGLRSSRVLVAVPGMAAAGTHRF